MTMRIKYSLLYCLLLAICSCKSKQNDVAHAPTIATDSISVQPDGSVKVLAHFKTVGTGALGEIGFCLDTVPNPSINSNKMLTSTVVDGKFSVTYTGLDALKRYYVRAFSSDNTGLVFGNDVVIDHAIALTAPPCNPADNSFVEEGLETDAGKYIYSDVLDPYTHRFTAYSNNMQLAFEFGKTPVTGVYQTSGSNDPDNGSSGVKITFMDNSFLYYEFPYSGTAYVTQVDATRIKVVLCHATIGTGFYITSSVTSGQ